MKHFLIRLVINALALSAAAWAVDGVHLTGGVTEILMVALIFGLVNALIKPIVSFFSLPFIVLTIGLFTFVINAAMLAITAGLTGYLSVDSFGAALMGSLVIALASLILSVFVEEKKKDK